MKKHALILFPKSTLSSGRNAFSWWQNDAAALGIQLDVAFFEDITLDYSNSEIRAMRDGVAFTRPDFVIMRGYSEELSLHFEASGIPVFNQWKAMELSHNKLLTHRCLATAGVPTPRTLYREEPLSYAEACKSIGSEIFVAKQPDSSRGENVFLVRSAEEYAAAVDSCRGRLLVQEYVASSHGRDLRVWTVGSRAVAQVMRHSPTSFLSNFSQGGSADAHELDVEAARIAVKAAVAVGLDFAGVDLLFTADGSYTVCEVNGNAGFRTLSAVGGGDIIKLFLEHISSKVYAYK